MSIFWLIFSKSLIFLIICVSFEMIQWVVQKLRFLGFQGHTRSFWLKLEYFDKFFRTPRVFFYHLRSFLNDPVSGSEVTILGFRRSSGVTLGHFKSSENILTTFFDLSGLFLGIPENLKKNRPPVPELVFLGFLVFL